MICLKCSKQHIEIDHKCFGNFGCTYGDIETLGDYTYALECEFTNPRKPFLPSLRLLKGKDHYSKTGNFQYIGVIDHGFRAKARGNINRDQWITFFKENRGKIRSLIKEAQTQVVGDFDEGENIVVSHNQIIYTTTSQHYPFAHSKTFFGDVMRFKPIFYEFVPYHGPMIEIANMLLEKKIIDDEFVEGMMSMLNHFKKVEQ